MKRSPRGFSLIELLTAMALFATILTVVALALGRLLIPSSTPIICSAGTIVLG